MHAADTDARISDHHVTRDDQRRHAARHGRVHESRAGARQARGSASDIWAFGCVLYEMLTGRRAFEGEDVSLTLSQILQRDPALDALPADVPARVRQTLHLCLKKPLKERLTDIGAARLMLEGAFETMPSGNRQHGDCAHDLATSGPVSPDGQCRRRPRRHWRLATDVRPGSRPAARSAVCPAVFGQHRPTGRGHWSPRPCDFPTGDASGTGRTTS